MRIDDYPMIYSNTDTIEHGQQTTYQFYWTPPANLIVLKVRIMIGFAHTVTAYSAGTFGITSASFRMATVLDTAGTIDEILVQPISKPATALTITANGSLAFTLNEVYNVPFIITPDKLVRFDCNLVSQYGTGTSFDGIMPTFPISQASGAMKPFYPSGIMLDCIPNTDANREVLSRNAGEFK